MNYFIGTGTWEPLVFCSTEQNISYDPSKHRIAQTIEIARMDTIVVQIPHILIIDVSDDPS